MTAGHGEPQTHNVEGAPTLVYEVWSWETFSVREMRHLEPEECFWQFIGYRTLSLRQVLRYAEFGYHVERSKDRDHRDLTPLFPRLGATGPGSRDRLD